MKPSIKLYGERNTNTRYLSRLIGQNLDAEELGAQVPQRLTISFIPLLTAA